MANNKFSKSLEDWNVSETRNLKEKVKRKASPETKTDNDDDKAKSNKFSATFSFSKSDIESSKKAAKLNLNIIGGPKVSKQTNIFRFLPADHNFKTKRLKKS